MKKITLLTILLISFTSFYAQEKANDSEEIDAADNNKWTLELTVGQGKGVRPYKVGYYSSDPGTFLGKPQANSFSAGARYMFTPVIGISSSLQYNDFKNIPNNGSKDWRLEQIGLSIEGVVNASRLLGLDQLTNRVGVLAHAGIRIDRMKSHTEDEFNYQDHNFNISEYNGGIVIGVTPQVRILKRLVLSLDVSIQNNYRQHFNWDGSYSEASENLNGQLITTSLGLSYSFGKNNMHGDFTKIRPKGSSELDKMTKRLGDIETQLDDTDKDGVPDYLDQENNSVAGVAVDTRGKMVDTNRNGVPDELERFLDTTYTTKESSDKGMVEKLINDGYVAAYYDFNKSQPTNESTEGIDFILTYLRNNPTATVDIYGHADEIGNTPSNITLSNKRAQGVKEILTKAGIAANRVNLVPRGEDTSVDVNSEGARKLVRRVTFKVNK